MNILYFLIIPILVSGFFVYREKYKTPKIYPDKKGKANPMSERDYIGVDIVYWLIFTGLYIWWLGFIRGVSGAFITLIIWFSWSKAVKKLRKDNFDNQLERYKKAYVKETAKKISKKYK
jgi:hypothetical protein